jgi:hypothetical protein
MPLDKRRRKKIQSDSKMYALELSSCSSLSSTLARLNEAVDAPASESIEACFQGERLSQGNNE